MNIIKSSIFSVYEKLIKADGNVLYLRLSRWLPGQFGFKCANKFSLSFWLERGFNEKDYIEFSKFTFKESSERLTKLAKELKNSLYVYDPSYSKTYKFNTTQFESDVRPVCNLCNSDLILKRAEINSTKLYNIKGCSNENCESVTNKKDIKWKAFLPESKYKEIKNKLKDVKRSFSKDFWIKRGYSEKDAQMKVFSIQSENSRKFKGKRTGKSKEILKLKGYTEEMIQEICLSPVNIKFWTKKGYSEDDAMEIISNHQKSASKLVDYEKRLLPSNTQYWVNKGYTELESKELVSKSQTTFSKSICIEKWGYEKGMEIFNQRTEKWLKSLKDNHKIFIGHSLISQEIFNEIKLRIPNRDFRYATNNGEFKIKKENGGFYFYDFSDVENKLIIEYNGDMYHANPEKYKADDFPHPFRKNIKASEIWEKDRLKIDIAECLGFKILIIWDSEYRYGGEEKKEKVIQRCINFLLENK